MFNKIFQKKDIKKDSNDVLITALLIHAAKMDENFTNKEKEIIKKSITKLFEKNEQEIEKIYKTAEKKEKESNQIIEFTREIKKNDMSYRLKILEMLWKIIYSDGVADMYETSLVRRVCGLLYIPSKEAGEIKKKLENK